MKNCKPFNKQDLLVISTFLVLTLLIIIQISLIFRAAQIEEQKFNHRVTLALKAARDEIAIRLPKCNDMSDFLCGRKCPDHIHKSKYSELDSIIKANLNIYNIDLPYTFEITDSLLHKSKNNFFNSTSYKQNLNGLLDQKGIQINLQFPSRNQYLISQLWGQLGISIIFLLFVMLSFLITWRLFRKEKELMVHTTDFINNMVHEFQTPITNIRFATNLIKKNVAGKLPEKAQEYTDVILNETIRLQTHVEAILKVASGTNNQNSKEIINIHKLIEHVIYTFDFRLKHAQASISFNAKASKYKIEAEWNPLTLAFSNLIDNALKYVTEKPNIQITTQNKNNNLLVLVKDNGIGIHKDDQVQIFDKFFRVYTGNVHNVKGFGLGLTYVKKVVEQCGGQIEIHSIPNKGSIFTLSFPLINNYVVKTNNTNN